MERALGMRSEERFCTSDDFARECLFVERGRLALRPSSRNSDVTRDD